MKRRDFLIQTAGFAGVSSLPLIGYGATKPCPPPSLNVNGGPKVTTSCTAPTGTADWATRSTGPGVVWAHNFEAEAEVRNFLWQNNIGNAPDPGQSDGTAVWDRNDGFAGGGSLSLNVPTGGLSNPAWIRPYSALVAGDNGRSVADPAAGGALTRRKWNHSYGYDQPWNFRTGFYGHQDYHTQYATWQGQSDVWDGTDFYIQFRVKFSASRWQGGIWNGNEGSGNPPGKLVFIDTTPVTSYQEVVIRSPAKWSWDRSTGAFDMYTSHGSYDQSFIGNPQGVGGGTAAMQPNGPGAQCYLGHTGAMDCWEWPADEWVTVLFHMIPGHNIDPLPATMAEMTNRDTGIEVWVARAGASSYTKIWDKKDYAWYFDSNNTCPPAFNAFKASAYMNNVKSVVGWSQKYTQIIFSKQFIPCPAA
jgi:hypothetical protein